MHSVFTGTIKAEYLQCSTLKKCATAVYWSRRYWTEIMDEFLCTRKFLYCVVVHGDDWIVSLFAITYFATVMQMRWLAGDYHLHGVHDWSKQSMKRIIDALHNAIVQVESHGSLFLDKIFINIIFSELSSKIAELAEHLELMIEKN